MQITTSTPFTARQLKPSFINKALTLLIITHAFLFSANAQTIYALSEGELISFNALIPGVISSTTTITGVTGGQTIVGMDYRPATGQLYAMGYVQASGNTQLYTINTSTGVATAVNPTPFVLAANLGKVSFDFNPTVDRIRVTGSNNMNYRLNPIIGSIAATDGDLAFATGDPNAGAEPSIGAGAYTNSYIAATATTLYNYDDSLNILTTQNPPNAGTLNTVGASGIVVDLSDATTDMDIFYNTITAQNVAYFVANVSGSDDNLYTINLSTGAATFVGAIGLTGREVEDIAVEININLPVVTGQMVYALTTNNNLISFDSENPGVIRSQLTPSALGTGQVLMGLDFRPATGELYGLGFNSGTNEAQLYTLNTTTGVATAVGTPSTLTLSGNIGFDFNPTVDRIRVIAVNDSNYRLHPVTGAIAATDGELAYATGDPNFGIDPMVGSGAYTNSYNGTTTTSLYNYDEGLNLLVLQNPPNAGTLNTVGASGITVNGSEPSVDLDIYYDHMTNTNMAYMAANTGTSSFDGFYTVNTTTGAATLVGAIGNGVGVKDIAVMIDSIPVIIGINEVKESNVTFSIFPNPATDVVNMKYEVTEAGRIEIALVDLMGRKVSVLEQGNRNTGTYQAALELNTAPGIYLVQIYNNGKMQQVSKLRVQ